jgi:hypothetical protein
LGKDREERKKLDLFFFSPGQNLISGLKPGYITSFVTPALRLGLQKILHNVDFSPDSFLTWIKDKK